MMGGADEGVLRLTGLWQKKRGKPLYQSKLHLDITFEFDL